MQKHKSAAAHLQTPTELILNLHSKQIVRESHVYVKIFLQKHKAHSHVQSVKDGVWPTCHTLQQYI